MIWVGRDVARYLISAILKQFRTGEKALTACVRRWGWDFSHLPRRRRTETD